MITCNPNWPENRDHPEMHDQNASDRPDLTCRIFRAKLQKMMESLKTGVLGKKIYHMYVVEFQKRGLPTRPPSSQSDSSAADHRPDRGHRLRRDPSRIEQPG